MQKKKSLKVERDAAGQFVRSKHGSRNDGVLSASPRVVTGSDDATFDTDPKPDARRPAGRSSLKER